MELCERMFSSPSIHSELDISPTIFFPKFSRYNYGNYNVTISNALIGRGINIGVLENITNI